MIYWHVERRSVCIYSQLKSCSSSEVAAIVGRGVNVRVGIDQLGGPSRRRVDRRLAEPFGF